MPSTTARLRPPVPEPSPAKRPDFPRPQKGSNSQHRLVTLLGEFWTHTDLPLPSHLIQELALDIGMSGPATSTALSRLATRGLLEQSNAGRRSRYRFTASAREGLISGFQRFASFSSAGDHWDGKWTIIAFTVPEADRAAREGLKSRLKWHGFAPLYGALWASPRADPMEMERICRAHGIEDYMIYKVNEAERLGTNPVEAWSLEAPRQRYAGFVERYSSQLHLLRSGDIDSKQAFVNRVELVDEWRTFPWDDPDLPPELLPSRWPLPSARRVFVELYNGYGPGASDYLCTKLGAENPDLAAAVHLLTMPDALSTDTA